jgi:hypothetical protein
MSPVNPKFNNPMNIFNYDKKRLLLSLSSNKWKNINSGKTQTTKWNFIPLGLECIIVSIQYDMKTVMEREKN